MNEQVNEEIKPQASIEITEGKIVVTCPLTDKILVYGVLECAKEEAARFFYAKQKMAMEIEKASREQGRGILSKIAVPGFQGRR